MVVWYCICSTARCADLLPGLTFIVIYKGYCFDQGGSVRAHTFITDISFFFFFLPSKSHCAMASSCCLATNSSAKPEMRRKSGLCNFCMILPGHVSARINAVLYVMHANLKVEYGMHPTCEQMFRCLLRQKNEEYYTGMSVLL